jgi:hypothetical protein
MPPDVRHIRQLMRDPSVFVNLLQRKSIYTWSTAPR